MIKIRPIKENNEKVEPHFRLVVTLGYGEHCTDAYTKSWMIIDDEKAKKYESLTDEEMDNMDWLELREISDYMTQEEAEKIVKFTESIWERKDVNGYDVHDIVLNDGCDSFWWKDMAAMTDEEFEWFEKIHDKYNTNLFNPEIEHNWYGIVGCEIEYVDENGKIHQCDVI